MELELIVDRFAEGLKYVDQNSAYIGSNQRTKATYLPGVPTMPEINVSKEVLEWWVATYPSDFLPSNAHRTEVPYPAISRAKCDIVFSSDGNWPDLPEWAVRTQLLHWSSESTNEMMWVLNVRSFIEKFKNYFFSNVRQFCIWSVLGQALIKVVALECSCGQVE